MQCQSLMCTRLVMLDCRRKKKSSCFIWTCHFHVTHKHKYHFILCGCMSVHVHTQDFRHKHSFRRQTHSFCQTLINLLGCSLWPVFMLLWVKSDLGITGDLSTAGLETHNYTLTAVCAPTQTHMLKVIFFSCSWHKKAPVLIIRQVKIMSMNRTACDCIFTSYFVLTLRSFPNKSIPITHQQQIMIYILCVINLNLIVPCHTVWILKKKEKKKKYIKFNL